MISNMTTLTTPPCPACSSVESIEVNIDDIAKYNAGAFVQDAFPDMPHDIRERFISGICGVCWDTLFQDEWHDC